MSLLVALFVLSLALSERVARVAASLLLSRAAPTLLQL